MEKDTKHTKSLIMLYKFQTMSDKDVFQARLKNEVIDFGFIPVWRFGRFVRFCKKHGLLYQPPTYFNGACLVKHNFRYVRTFSKVSHLPFGRLAEWLADFFYPRGGPYMKYARREVCIVKPRGTRSGFTYVVATSAGITL
jgi:hypothetical protein